MPEILFPIVILITALSKNYPERVFVTKTLNQKTTTIPQLIILTRLAFPLTLVKKFKNVFMKDEEEKTERPFPTIRVFKITMS
jgi:hypothetical protein